MVEARIVARRPADRCPYCRGTLLTEDLVECGGCDTTYHEACWNEGGGWCATVGCPAASTRRSRAAPPATEPAARTDAVAPATPARSRGFALRAVLALLLIIVGLIVIPVAAMGPPALSPAAQVEAAHRRALALRAEGKYAEAGFALKQVEDLYYEIDRDGELYWLQRELFLLADLTPEQQARLAAAEREQEPWQRVRLLEQLHAELEALARQNWAGDGSIRKRADHVKKLLDAARAELGRR